MEPSSASASPARPTLTAPMTRTRHAASRARSTTQPTRARSSSGGSVFGIAHTVVNPPWAAACAPEAIVSAPPSPGSRRWACRSQKPGASDQAAGIDPLRTGGQERADPG